MILEGYYVCFHSAAEEISNNLSYLIVGVLFCSSVVVEADISGTSSLPVALWYT